jgi:hypothetical protein
MRSIMDSVNGGGADAGSTVGNLMSLYGQQQNMLAQRELMTQAAAIAQRLNMPLGVVQAEIMAGHGPDLIRNLEPTDLQKNIEWQHNQYISSGGTEDEWRQNVLPTLMMGGMPGMTPDLMSYEQEVAKWRRENPGKPLPPEIADFTRWQNTVRVDQETAKAKKDEVLSAQTGMNDVLSPLQSMQSSIDNLQQAYQSGKLDNILKLPEGGIESLARGGRGSIDSWLKAYVPGSSALGLQWNDEDVNLAKQIAQLAATNMKALGQSSARHAAPQFETIGSKLPGLTSYAGKEQWGANLGVLRDAVLNGEASVYGSANITPTDQDLLERIGKNPLYTAGGEWNLRTPQPLSEAQLQKAVEGLKRDPTQRGTVIARLKGGNYDTAELERRLNQGG